MGKKTAIDSKVFILETAVNADFTSAEANILGVDRMALDFAWTGTYAATLIVQVSNKGVNWETIDETAVPAGAPGSALVEIETSAKLLRVFADYTSGTGDLECYLTAKSMSN